MSLLNPCKHLKPIQELNISVIDQSKPLSFDPTFISKKWLSPHFSLTHDVNDDIKLRRQLSECSNFVLIGQRSSETARRICAKVHSGNPSFKSAIQRASWRLITAMKTSNRTEGQLKQERESKRVDERLKLRYRWPPSLVNSHWVRLVFEPAQNFTRTNKSFHTLDGQMARS